jgi:hypothetical protein
VDLFEKARFFGDGLAPFCPHLVHGERAFGLSRK